MKKTILIVLALSLSLSLFAQRPKMHLKAKLGVQSLSYVYKQDTISREFFYGLHGGFGFRVMKKKLYGELGFDFFRNYITFIDEDLNYLELKLNSFELPITVGYVTTNKTRFKHFLYGGIITEFKIRSFLSYPNIPSFDPTRIKPKELSLRNPNFLMRLGTQFDVTMFNIDLNYSFGLIKPIKANFRTQSHSLHLTLGLVF